MKHSLILWSASLLLTFLTGYLHSGTSEYYPVTGTIGIDGKKVSYRFEKIYKGEDNYQFIIRTDNNDIRVIMKWKKENDDNWRNVEMKPVDNALISEIPLQKANEKILYYAEIKKGNESYSIPDKPVSLLFLGNVPSMIGFLSSFSLFGGLLLSFRTGLEFFNEHQKIKKLSLFTVTFFFVYSIAVTPLQKSYEFNAINHKILQISSLFDVYSLILFSVWIIGMIVLFKVKNQKPAALVFSILTVLVFLFIRF